MHLQASRYPALRHMEQLQSRTFNSDSGGLMVAVNLM